MTDCANARQRQPAAMGNDIPVRSRCQRDSWQEQLGLTWRSNNETRMLRQQPRQLSSIKQRDGARHLAEFQAQRPKAIAPYCTCVPSSRSPSDGVFSPAPKLFIIKLACPLSHHQRSRPDACTSLDRAKGNLDVQEPVQVASRPMPILQRRLLVQAASPCTGAR